MESSDKNIAIYLSKEQNNVTTLILGASQNKRAINPKYLNQSALNMAHSRQDYWIDYQILKEMNTRLPSLEKVVISSTVRHFESPIGRKTWQLRPLLLHYDINLLDKKTYFKDRFLFLSNPRFYKIKLQKYYIDGYRPIISELGYVYDDENSPFNELNREPLRIKNNFLDRYPRLDKRNMQLNISGFLKIVQLCKEKNLKLIITSTPTLDIYTESIDTLIIKRRDSILKETVGQHNNIRLFNEESTDFYKAEDFFDYNHLNSKGAEKFTKKLDSFMNYIPHKK